ncbi:TetR family transcriptional regulator [Kitasatospora sp. NPDC092948]|uniref:TetR/AcrR family transcriptional regulator n=1 Tax=Kitasatospora sp. NPDC092948 TaxID=3364088 RepID=UPI003813CAA8
MTQPRKRNRAATTAGLLAAARARFALLGYDATNVRDIAQDAGVDATLIFRYFGSKQRLFEEALAPIDDQDDLPPDGEPEDIPTRLLHSTMRQDSVDHPLIALLRSSSREECRERLNTQLYDTYVRNLEGLLDQPDRELRAELLTAWLLGINVARTIAHTPALSNACVDDISPFFDQVTAVLLGSGSALKPAGAEQTAGTAADGQV